MPGNGLKERVIQGQGTPEAVWRPWLRAQPFAPMPKTALLGEARRLVVVAPHPDDEVLACGGLLATQAQFHIHTGASTCRQPTDAHARAVARPLAS